jgi:hypothetical protein
MRKIVVEIPDVKACGLCRFSTHNITGCRVFIFAVIKDNKPCQACLDATIKEESKNDN